MDRGGARSGAVHGPEAGTILAGRFLVVGVIGRGGMGIVVRARDQVTGDEVAVKHVRPDLAEDPDYAQRLVREAQLAKDVSHHNVCRVHDVYPHEDEVLLSMEYVAGETLRARLGRGPLPRAEAMSIARQICAGVAAAHQKGVVHRDLKPENVLIDQNGRAVVLDFGVARKEGTPRETMTGLVQGTPRYMAPEQQQGRAVSPATDVFALGLVIEELFGDRPPPGVRAIIRKATERDPQRRYPDAAALGRNLAHPLLRRGLMVAAFTTPVALVGAVLLLGPAGLLGQLLRSSRPIDGAGSRLAEPQPELMTRQWGNAGFGTLSPNGKILAFTEQCDDVRIGYLRPLLKKDAKPRQFSDSLHSVTWISFAPDGRRLVYGSGRFPIDRQSQVFLVDLGADGMPAAPARRLTDGMTPSWFPSGDSVVLSRHNPRTGRTFLSRIPADGSAEATPIPTDPPEPIEISPVVSPDGRSVAFLTKLGIRVVPVAGGRVQGLPGASVFPDRLAWTHDSRFLFYGTDTAGLQAVTADGKRTVQLLSATQEPRTPSLDREGRVMVYTRQPDRFDLRFADRDGKNPRTVSLPITTARISYPLYSSDGRAIAAAVTGSEELRVEVLPNSRPERTLIAVGKERFPQSFIDHDRALIVRDRVPRDHLLVLALTKAPAPPIRFAENDTNAAVAPDGRRLATARAADQANAVANGIWVRDLYDPPENAVRWIEDGYGNMAWSPDGTRLAAGTTNGFLAIATGPGQVRRVRLHLADNQPLNTRNVRFTGNDKILFLAQPRVYEYDLKTEQIRPYLSFAGVAYIFGFSLSPDGHDVVFVAQEPTSDIWMLRDPVRLLQSRLSAP